MSSAPFEGDTELQELVIDQSHRSTPLDPDNFAAADNLAAAGIEPAAFSTPKPQEQVKQYDQGEISDERLLEVQSLKEGEAQPETETEDLRAALSVSRTDLSSRKAQSDSVTGLPSAAQVAGQFETNLPATKLASQANFEFIDEESLTSTSLLIRQNDVMGAAESRGTPTSSARNIMTAEPQDLVQNRKRVLLSEVTGNCRPWSDHVYYKLFMDTEGRNATLMVLKCEISYVDVFTDEEHSLYKSRFIGGKSDGVAQLFVFDLMKASWEEKIPKSQAIELNVDIVMSSSPIHFCCDSLLSLIQLEKTFLKHRNFDGQLNVMIRFAHGFGWDIKDDAIREKVHTGLRNLFREGVNLEVMSADVIMEEMRVDGILTTDDERLKHYIARRHSWAGPPIKTKKPHGTSSAPEAPQTSLANSQAPRHRLASSSSSEEDYETLSEDDMYHVFLLDKLDQILARQYPSKRPALKQSRVRYSGSRVNQTVDHEKAKKNKIKTFGITMVTHTREYFRSQSTKSPDNTGANRDGSDYGETSGRESLSTFGRKAAAVGRGDSLASMTDEYFHYLHTSLWNIIQDTKRIQDILSETIDDN